MNHRALRLLGRHRLERPHSCSSYTLSMTPKSATFASMCIEQKYITRCNIAMNHALPMQMRHSRVASKTTPNATWPSSLPMSISSIGICNTSAAVAPRTVRTESVTTLTMVAIHLCSLRSSPCCTPAASMSALVECPWYSLRAMVGRRRYRRLGRCDRRESLGRRRTPTAWTRSSSVHTGCQRRVMLGHCSHIPVRPFICHRRRHLGGRARGSLGRLSLHHPKESEAEHQHATNARHNSNDD